jgi:hypothetical protein
VFKPTVTGVMLFFRRVDVSTNLDGIYTLGYRFIDGSNEDWTRRFNGFKYGYAQPIRGASKTLPAALATSSFSSTRIVLTSALPSDAAALPKTHPLRTLGFAVAQATGWNWLPDLLTKQKHRKLVKLGYGKDRDEEVENKYTAQPVRGATTCVILDDFITRGATMNEAARAIRSSSGTVKRVFGLALGKNEKLSYARQFGMDLSNDHIPADLLQKWDAA